MAAFFASGILMVWGKPNHKASSKMTAQDFNKISNQLHMASYIMNYQVRKAAYLAAKKAAVK